MPDGIIAVIDDDEAVRHSTAEVLQRSGFPVETFTSGDYFLSAAVIESMSCILLDLHMPGTDGLAVLAALHERSDPPPVIVLTGHGDLAAAIDAMKLGACDFIEKPYETEALLTSIRTALEGNRDVRDAAAARARAIAQVGRLTSRQRQVLLGILKGLQNKMIAYELGLSIRTVETYRAQLLEKLGVHGTAEAVRFALDAGLADEPFGRDVLLSTYTRAVQ
jgi:two-component system response regulator FixJ